MGSKTALDRIFQNLLQNACRYANSYIRIVGEIDEETVIINFQNDTKMVNQEDIPHLFERFYMQDRTRNQGGTGLGLTVAQLLTEEMGAQLNVRTLSRDISTLEEENLHLCFSLSLKRFPISSDT